MDQSRLLRTWTVNENEWKIRFYKWAYKGDLTKLTFCRLFWACTAAAPFAIIIRLVSGMLPKSRPESAKPKVNSPPPAPRTKSDRGAEWATRFSAWVSRAADYVVSKFQPIGAFLERHRRIGKILRYGVLGLVVVALLSGLGIGFYFWQDFSSQSLEFVGGVLGLAVGVIVAAVIVVTVADRYSKTFRKFGDWFLEITTPIGHFFVGIGHFFSWGYYATKTRTCPRIEVVRKNTTA